MGGHCFFIDVSSLPHVCFGNQTCTCQCDVCMGEAKSKPEPPKPRTVRVRIPVFVTTDGRWKALYADSEHQGEGFIDVILRYEQRCESQGDGPGLFGLRWVEADCALPDEPAVIRGEVVK